MMLHDSWWMLNDGSWWSMTLTDCEQWFWWLQWTSQWLKMTWLLGRLMTWNSRTKKELRFLNVPRYGPVYHVHASPTLAPRDTTLGGCRLVLFGSGLEHWIASGKDQWCLEYITDKHPGNLGWKWLVGFCTYLVYAVTVICEMGYPALANQHIRFNKIFTPSWL